MTGAGQHHRSRTQSHSRVVHVLGHRLAGIRYVLHAVTQSPMYVGWSAHSGSSPPWLTQLDGQEIVCHVPLLGLIPPARQADGSRELPVAADDTERYEFTERYAVAGPAMA
jgi:hypothetical protein